MALFRNGGPSEWRTPTTVGWAGDILFRCFVSSTPASVESLSVHAYQSVTFISSKVYYTSDVTIQFK